MPRFLSDLIFKDNDGESWTLICPLIYESEAVSPDYIVQIVVPRGFVTDLASIPQFAQNLISKTGPWDWPAVIHDWLYATQIYPREIADKILLEAMILKGVGVIRRQLIYRAVRLGGWAVWDA